MLDILSFEQEPAVVPLEVVEADPIAAMRALYQRVARLERTLAEQEADVAQAQQKAIETQREVLLAVIAMHDHLAETVEHFGVTTNAREAGLVRRLFEFARLLRDILASYEVVPLQVVGQPFDEAVAEQVGTEYQSAVSEGVVLREVQVGYRWPHGVLRRAQVIVNKASNEEG